MQCVFLSDMVVKWVNLILQVAWALVVTNWLCTIELFHIFIWSRRQKCVKGKVVVVTGAAHGLGRRIAREFAKLGALVVCWDCDAERNQNTVWDIKQSNGKAFNIVCDVSDRNQVFQSVASVRENVGEIDILVNCVGVYPVQPTLLWTPEELYALFDSNVMAQFWLLQAVVPHMIKRGFGHLAVISSAAAIAPVPGELPYSVTKSAITGLMDGYLRELQQQGHENIKVTCVHPYYTAVREDIPVKYDLRFERLSPDYVAGEILRGIREEQEVISVPRFLLFWIQFMKLLPHTARRKWRDIFYTRVYPTDAMTYYTPAGEKLNIVDLYKLPPIGSEHTSRADSLTRITVLNNNNNNNCAAPPIATKHDCNIVIQSAEISQSDANMDSDRMTVATGHDNAAYCIERF